MTRWPGAPWKVLLSLLLSVLSPLVTAHAEDSWTQLARPASDPDHGDVGMLQRSTRGATVAAGTSRVTITLNLQVFTDSQVTACLAVGRSSLVVHMLIGQTSRWRLELARG